MKHIKHVLCYCINMSPSRSVIPATARVVPSSHYNAFSYRSLWQSWLPECDISVDHICLYAFLFCCVWISSLVLVNIWLIKLINTNGQPVTSHQHYYYHTHNHTHIHTHNHNQTYNHNHTHNHAHSTHNSTTNEISRKNRDKELVNPFGLLPGKSLQPW